MDEDDTDDDVSTVKLGGAQSRQWNPYWGGYGRGWGRGYPGWRWRNPYYGGGYWGRRGPWNRGRWL
jgi:hypothetical protein